MKSSLRSSLPLHRQISASLREEIVHGRILEGDRLPAMEAMAKDWGTSYFTIRRALAPLVREGLLEPRGKLGTVVIGPKPTLTCVGIYYGADIWSIPEAAVYRSIHQELRRQIEAEGMTLKPFIESRPERQHHVPPADVARMVEERSIQGLIIPIADEPEIGWIGRLPIPKSYFGSAPVSWRVQQDLVGALRAALIQLREEGVRDVGLIANVSTQYKAPHPPTLFFEGFVDALEEFGMRTQNHWCAIPGELLKPHESERFGYEAFQKIWNTHPQQRPKGLICVSDVVGRGLFSALLEKQIAVPDELKVVQYKSKHIGFFTTLKVHWIVWDEAAIAAALLRQLQSQIQGDEPKEILLSNCRE